MSAKKLNIVFYYYPSLWMNKGGLQNQILLTKEALEGLGHTVFFYEDWIRDKDKIQIDIYHQFSCNYTIFALFSEIKSLGNKIVLSSVFNDDKSTKNIVASKLDDIGIPILFHKSVKKMMRGVDAIISLGLSETQDLIKYSNPRNGIIEIPNGVSKPIMNYDIRTIIKKDYIVCVGTINKRKNQLSLIKICNELNLNLILIGPSSKTEIKYINQCKKIAGENVTFLGYMDNNSNKFMEIISKAKLFVLPSLNEVLPISVFEALILGTPVVCTQNSSVGTYLKKEDGCLLCDPTSHKSIVTAIKSMYGFKMDHNLITSFKEKYNWDSVAKKIEDVYFETLKY